MGFHTFPIDRADALEDPSRYRFCSREELLESLGPALANRGGGRVADLGSGTGFYADDVAPFVETLYAVDVQEEMHERYREKGVPDAVSFVTAEVAALPFEDDHLDGAYSTMTHHEYASETAFDELARVIKPNGVLVTVDWSADGTGEDGPSVDERYGLEDACEHLESAGFTIEEARNRPETFVIVGRR